MSTRARSIGFIGLGKMGRPMAHLLCAAGHRLVLYDIDAQSVAQFAASEPNARVAGSPADLALVDTLITMLPDSDAVELALFGGGDESGVAQVLAPGTCVIDMSSSEPTRSRDVSNRLGQRGIAFLDAPVSGGVKRALGGSLAIIVGGPAALLESRRDLFELLGSTVTHVGDVGAGHAAKALNNYVSAAGLAATAEALQVARVFGIDPEVMTDVLNNSSGRNNTTENKVRQFMLSGRFDSGFAMPLMAKDLGIATSLGKSIGMPMRLGEAVERLWRSAALALPPSADHTELYRFLNEGHKRESE